VEALILDGRAAYPIIEELLTETTSRKAQIEDHERRVLDSLITNLHSYGIRITPMRPGSIIRLKSIRFCELLHTQGIRDGNTQLECTRLLQNSKDQMIYLNMQLDVLERIESYLEDWLWGVMYMNTRQLVNEPHYLQ
jgi:hypothetical protein